MKRTYGRFFWKLFLGNAVLLIAVAATSVGMILSAFQRLYEQDQIESLRLHARILAADVAAHFDTDQTAYLQQLADRLKESSAGKLRCTFMRPDGTVLADSHRLLPGQGSVAISVEVEQAVGQGAGVATRWSHDLSRDMHYAAVRMDGPDGPLGIVRVGIQRENWASRISAGRELPWIIGLVLLLAGLLLALGLSLLWSRPMAELTTAVNSMSRGEWPADLNLGGTDEFGSLARSLNQMRDHFAGQLGANYRQRRTLEYLLAQLQEGVVVVGENGRIMLINPAAARMLGIAVSITSDGRLVDGLTVETCIPQHEVQRMLVPTDHFGETSAKRPSVEYGATQSHDDRFEEERIAVRHSAGTVTLLARASNIFLPRAVNGHARALGPESPVDDTHPDRGRLLVLTDITELTQTLQIKSDFVANASHELRTPLSAIRAAVETLQSLNLAEDTAAAVKLLTVVDRHSARLEALVADLLSLSRLESSAAEFEPALLYGRDIFAEIEEQFATIIRDKQLAWEATFTGDDCIVANKQLLRLVLDNVVDNATKFTDRGGAVRLTGWRQGSDVVFMIEDKGCGIPPEDHARVFERFYQVGRARSGPNRGTGLGLSIVRHAVAGMRGSVDLVSAPGKGTRLTITVPQPADIAVA